MAYLKFTLVREIDVSAGFVADADPRVTNPLAAAHFDMKSRVTDQSADENVKGVSLYTRCVDGTGAEIVADTVDFICFALDAGASVVSPGPGAGANRYTWLTKESGAKSSALYSAPLIGKLYVQYTAMTRSTSTKIQLFVAERS